MDFRLKRMISCWKKSDPAPDPVKPIPIQVIRRVAILAQHATSELFKAVADMIIIAFFFLLRPGEYTDNDINPFRLEDVQLFIGPNRLNLLVATDAQLLQTRFASLTFTDQKNGVRGEVIGHARSGDQFLCPVKAILRRVIYLRSNNAPPNTPLSRVYNTKLKVTAKYITQTLRDSIDYLGDTTIGFLKKEVSARSLRAAGAQALMLGKVDTNIIRLIGRWKSDAMLRYLHVQAHPLMQDYASIMLKAGTYTLIPNQYVPQLR